MSTTEELLTIRTAQLQAAHQHLAELDGLLKRVYGIRHNSRGMYWNDVQGWVVKEYVYRKQIEPVLYEGPSLLGALRALVGKEA